MDEENVQRDVPLTWIGADDLPVLFANTFVGQVQAQEGVFYLTVGQFVPPALIGTPQEQAEQIEQIAYVPVKPVARLALTRARLQELAALLQTNLDQYDQIMQQMEGGNEI